MYRSNRLQFYSSLPYENFEPFSYNLNTNNNYNNYNHTVFSNSKIHNRSSSNLRTSHTPIVISLRNRGIRAAQNKLYAAEQIISRAMDENRIRNPIAFMSYLSLAGNDNRKQLLQELNRGAFIE